MRNVYRCKPCDLLWVSGGDVRDINGRDVNISTRKCPLCANDYGWWDWWYYHTDEFMQFALNAKRNKFYGRPR